MSCRPKRGFVDFRTNKTPQTKQTEYMRAEPHTRTQPGEEGTPAQGNTDGKWSCGTLELRGWEEVLYELRHGT